MAHIWPICGLDSLNTQVITQVDQALVIPYVSGVSMYQIGVSFYNPVSDWPACKWRLC